MVRRVLYKRTGTEASRPSAQQQGIVLLIVMLLGMLIGKIGKRPFADSVNMSFFSMETRLARTTTTSPPLIGSNKTPTSADLAPQPIATSAPEPIQGGPPPSAMPTVAASTSAAILNSGSENNDPRPRGLRLAFMGDSLARYQYISLIYYLRFGKWWEHNTTEYSLNLVEERTYGNGFKGMFEKQADIFNGYEKCDCFRGHTAPPIGVRIKKDRNYWSNITENRYFYDPIRDNAVSFILAFGHRTPQHGNEDPTTVFKSIQDFKYEHVEHYPSRWSFDFWDQTVRHHISRLDPKPTHLIMNAGLWEHNFNRKFLRRRLRDSIAGVGIVGIWKTTTYNPKDPNSYTETTLDTDRNMCAEFGSQRCFDLTWTGCVDERFAHGNGVHFDEPMYRIMNEDLLGMIGKPIRGQLLGKNTVLPTREVKSCIMPGSTVFNRTIGNFVPS